MAAMAFSRRFQPSNENGCTPTTITLAPERWPSSTKCSASATPVAPPKPSTRIRKSQPWGDLGQALFLDHHDLAREVKIAAATEAMNQRATEQLAVRNDGRADRLLVGVVDPEIVPRRPRRAARSDRRPRRRSGRVRECARGWGTAGPTFPRRVHPG